MSEIKVDTLTGKTTANDITVTVGASVTMSMEQGLAKGWLGANNAAVQQDTLNFSSSSDDGTGIYTHTLTNAMSVDMENSGLSVTAGGGTRFARYGGTNTTTTDVEIRIHITSGADTYSDHNAIIHGDLA